MEPSDVQELVFLLALLLIGAVTAYAWIFH
jgi:hypothetical protein